MRPPDNEDQLPRMLAGRYRLEAELGHGGMGVVYRGTDTLIGRRVAVKLIRAAEGIAIDEEVAGRFLREAKHTARIQHEHIIEVYDLGRSETGDLFFVMELLEGESVSARLRRLGRIPVVQTIHIARQICAALDVAHAAGIIHRDLKPANVMLLQRKDDDAFVKVLDFGVAKSYAPDQQDTDLTNTGMLVGTIEYMAPEQIMGKKADGRTDIYSLGVMLYKMLVGRQPFREGAVPAMIHWHLNVAPKPLSTVVDDVPAAIDRIVLRCLAKKPDERYANMNELANALMLAASPDDLGLVSLEYDADGDPYSGGTLTHVAKPKREEIIHDDATIKMDRSGSGKRPAPPPPPQAVHDADKTALMRREDSSASSSGVDDPTRVEKVERGEPRVCAMCQTVNPAKARSCSACGVSLAADEQAAVRARVTAPRPASIPAPAPPPPVPPMPPTVRAQPQPPKPMPMPPMQHAAQPNAPPQNHTQPLPRHMNPAAPVSPQTPAGVPAVVPWHPHPIHDAPAPKGAWERFKRWMKK